MFHESIPVGRPHKSPKFRLRLVERSLYIDTTSDLTTTGERKGGPDEHVPRGVQREMEMFWECSSNAPTLADLYNGLTEV